MKKAFGFTLIELMIAVALVAILGLVALPAYQDSVRKSKRRTAEAFMMELAQREQAVLLDRRSYLVGANVITNPPPTGLGMATPSEIANSYTFAIAETTAGGAPDFTITATAINAQDYKDSEDLVLRSDGYKARGNALVPSSLDQTKW